MADIMPPPEAWRVDAPASICPTCGREPVSGKTYPYDEDPDITMGSYVCGLRHIWLVKWVPNA